MTSFTQTYKKFFDSFTNLLISEDKGTSELQTYELIPIKSVKRAEDVKELWLVYYLDSIRQKTQLKDFLKNHLDEAAKKQINDTWNFKLKVQDLDDNKLAVIASDLNLKEPFLLKMDFIEILEAYSSRMRCVIQGSTKILSRDYLNGKNREKYDTLSWISLFHPKLIGVKTKFGEMVKDLPELKGIFESTTNTDLVDIKVELNSKDRYGNMTTPDEIQRAPYYIIRFLESLTNKQYEWKLGKNGFSILDIPSHIAEDCIQKLNKAIDKISMWLTGGVYYLDRHSIKQVEIDEQSAKTRHLVKKLPELKGIFESKQEKDKLVLTFSPTYGTTDHDRLRLALKSFKLKMSYVTRQVVPNSLCNCKIVRYNKGFKFVISFEKENLLESLSEETKNTLARMINTQWNGTKIDFELSRSIDYTAKWISRYDKMLKQLPELEGIFESKQQNSPDSVLAKFTNLDKTNKKLLWKFLEEKKKSTFRYTLYDKGPKEVHALIQLMNPEFYTQPGKVHILKRSLEQMFVQDAHKVAPDMEWRDVVDKRLPEIFKNCDMVLINKGIHELQQRLPELEGIFESQEPETVLVARYKGDASKKEYLYKILKSIANAFEKTSVETVEETNGEIIMELAIDLTESFLKESPNVQKELRPWRHHWETTVYNDYYDSLRDLRRREIITGEYISVMPEFVWKTRHYFLSNKLPELKGIFESKEEPEIVDIVIEVKPTDKFGTPTSREILEIMAKNICVETAKQMVNEWDTGKLTYEDLKFKWEIKQNPNKIILLDVFKNISETYQIELRGVLFMLDRYIGSTLSEDYNYTMSGPIFGEVYLDEEHTKLRKMRKNLPELEGIF